MTYGDIRIMRDAFLRRPWRKLKVGDRGVGYRWMGLDQSAETTVDGVFGVHRETG